MSTSATDAMTVASALATGLLQDGEGRTFKVHEVSALMQACALVGIAEGIRRIAAEMERRSS